MKVQTRLVYFFIISIFLFLLVFIFFRNVERKAIVSLFQKDAQEKERVFDKLLKLREGPLKALAFDYTYWDEMSAAVVNDDKDWARTSLSTSVLANFNINGMWIYNASRQIYYSIDNLKEDGKAVETSFPPALFDKLSRERFVHFFIKVPAGLIELRAATIHPSNDVERKTEPQGYFFAGRLWDSAYIKELSELTDSTIRLGQLSDGVKGPLLDLKNGIVTFSREFNSWDDKPLMQLAASRVSGEIREFNETTKKYFPLLSIFAGALLILIIWVIIDWIFLPLYSISASLKNADLKYLQRLKDKKTEFGDIARLVCDFFRLKQMKSSLAQMIVHDLNNPLAGILGYAQLAQLELDNLLSEDQKNSFNWIVYSAKEMQSMISNLLDIDKMEEGKFILRYGEVNFSPLFGEIANTMNVIAQLDQKTISFETLPGPTAQADRDILKRVISNLIGNALKFTPAGTTIKVQACHDKENKQFVLSIKDQGAGIPKEYLSRVFDKFVQVEAAQAKGRTGKGLGLTFCKMAVEAHGGKIWVESEEGKGATFYFTLPEK